MEKYENLNNDWQIKNEYNCVELRKKFDNNDWHAWILKRMDYCDRGNWNWNYNGPVFKKIYDEEVNVEYFKPSMYFISLENAIREINEFIFRVTNGVVKDAELGEVEKFNNFNSWVFKKSNNTYNQIFSHNNINAFATIEKNVTPLGDMWVLDIDCEELYLDASDDFPRKYFNKDIAFSEAERFIELRVKKNKTLFAEDELCNISNKVDENGIVKILTLPEDLKICVTNDKNIKKSFKKIKI